MRTLVILIGLLGTMLLLTDDVFAQATAQYGQISCIAPTTGGAPSSVQVQREVTNSGSWSNIGPQSPLPGTVPDYVDTSRTAGTSYRYRCVYANASGSTPTDPSPAFTFLDPIPVPGKGSINVIIITQPVEPPQGAAPAMKVAPKGAPTVKPKPK